MIHTQILYPILFALHTLASCNGSIQAKVSEDGAKEKLSVVTSLTTETVTYGSGDVVSKGYLDSSGNMWFTTTLEGVFKYDGNSFVNYTVEGGLCANQVWAVLEDKDGIMWFGTAEGLCRFDGTNFKNIPIPKNDQTSEWLTKGYPIINPDAITSIIQAHNGDYWIGSNGGGAFHYDGTTFTSFLKDKGALMPDSLYNNVVLSIAEDTEENIWFTSFSHGAVSKYDGSVLTHYGVEDGLRDDMIASSYLDRSGKLWVGTRSGGMSYFNGETFTTIHEPEGRCNNNMATILEDSSGRMWVASFARAGVCWYGGDSFTPFDIQGSENLIDIKCMSEDGSGNIWFGGRYGILWRYDGKELKDFTQIKRNG